MDKVSILPIFYAGQSNTPWIERFEQNGWTVPRRVKYEYGVTPTAAYCPEYDTILGWGEVDVLKEMTRNEGVEMQIYFEED